MSKKIEGRVNYLMGSYAFLPGKEQPPKGNPWKCSTLVIHDDKHERLFTESEVRVMALEAIALIRRDIPQSPEHIGRAGGAIAKALLGHGIVLDPA